MVPVKIQCGCGQKYSFDVEPVNGRMPSNIACPVCQMDGTTVANQIIAQTLAAIAPVQAPQAHPTAHLQAAPSTPPPLPVARAFPVQPAARQVVARKSAEYSLGRGILGAIIGAVVGIGAMYAFFLGTGIRFPLLGVGIGALIGYGARLLARGNDSSLGYISGFLALISVVGTLYLMYGEFPIVSIISVLVSVSVAYRISS